MVTKNTGEMVDPWEGIVEVPRSGDTIPKLYYLGTTPRKDQNHWKMEPLSLNSVGYTII